MENFWNSNHLLDFDREDSFWEFDLCINDDGVAALSSGTGGASGQHTPAAPSSETDSEFHQLMNTNIPSILSPSAEKAFKKRRSDQAYRDRLKQKKMESETNMTMLNDKNRNLGLENWQLKYENGNLVRENENLRDENINLKQRVTCLTQMVERLGTDFHQSELRYSEQNALVQNLNQQLAHRDLQLEIEKLKFENAQLKHNANLDDRVSQLERKTEGSNLGMTFS